MVGDASAPWATVLGGQGALQCGDVGGEYCGDIGEPPAGRAGRSPTKGERRVFGLWKGKDCIRVA